MSAEKKKCLPSVSPKYLCHHQSKQSHLPAHAAGGKAEGGMENVGLVSCKWFGFVPLGAPVTKGRCQCHHSGSFCCRKAVGKQFWVPCWGFGLGKINGEHCPHPQGDWVGGGSQWALHAPGNPSSMKAHLPGSHLLVFGDTEHRKSRADLGIF